MFNDYVQLKLNRQQTEAALRHHRKRAAQAERLAHQPTEAASPSPAHRITKPDYQPKASV